LKKLIFTTVIFSSLLFSATIHLEISNIEKQKGSLIIGLYNIKKDFPRPSKALQKLILNSKGRILKGTFKNLPNGIYAIAVYHDENNNKILDKNFLGIPKEGYGFSNNFKPMFSKPKFEDAKFTLKESTTLKIKMNY